MEKSLITKDVNKKPLINCDDWLPKFMVVSLIMGLGLLIGAVIFVPGAQEENQIIMMVIGALLAKTNTAFDYFFGSSNSFKNNGKDKEEKK